MDATSASDGDAADGGIELVIKSVYQHASIRLLVFPSNTVAELKELIATSADGFSPPPEVASQTLIFAGRICNNADTVQQVVKSASTSKALTFHLIVRPTKQPPLQRSVSDSPARISSGRPPRAPTASPSPSRTSTTPVRALSPAGSTGGSAAPRRAAPLARSQSVPSAGSPAATLPAAVAAPAAAAVPPAAASAGVNAPVAGPAVAAAGPHVAAGLGSAAYSPAPATDNSAPMQPPAVSTPLLAAMSSPLLASMHSPLMAAMHSPMLGAMQAPLFGAMQSPLMGPVASPLFGATTSPLMAGHAPPLMRMQSSPAGSTQPPAAAAHAAATANLQAAYINLMQQRLAATQQQQQQQAAATPFLQRAASSPAALGGVPWFQLPGAQPVSGAMDAHARSWFDAMQARARAQSGAGVGNTDVAGADAGAGAGAASAGTATDADSTQANAGAGGADGGDNAANQEAAGAEGGAGDVAADGAGGGDGAAAPVAGWRRIFNVGLAVKLAILMLLFTQGADQRRFMTCVCAAAFVYLYQVGFFGLITSCCRRRDGDANGDGLAPPVAYPHAHRGVIADTVAGVGGFFTSIYPGWEPPPPLPRPVDEAEAAPEGGAPLPEGPGLAQ